MSRKKQRCKTWKQHVKIIVAKFNFNTCALSWRSFTTPSRLCLSLLVHFKGITIATRGIPHLSRWPLVWQILKRQTAAFWCRSAGCGYVPIANVLQISRRSFTPSSLAFTLRRIVQGVVGHRRKRSKKEPISMFFLLWKSQSIFKWLLCF
jgi:hypothetical protein